MTYVDWIFVPFNYLVVRAIDWRRGGAIFVILLVSVVANILGHAIWQYGAVDGGHMITSAQVVLPAGWVHLGFSIIEATLLLAFVFVREIRRPLPIVATLLALLYFVSAGVSGYMMNRRFMATDVIMVTSGLAALLIYPYWRRRWVTTGRRTRSPEEGRGEGRRTTSEPAGA